MEYAVITAIGPDTVGIMDRLADAVNSSGANIEETRASILGGEFAVIMLVSGAGGVSVSLAASIQAAGEAMGLTVALKPTRGPTKPSGIPYIIESVSLDTPGIVHAITRMLKARGINIEDLESSVMAAPLSGSPMFSMKICVNLVPGAKLASLKEELRLVSEEHDLDIDIRPLKPADIA